MSDQHILSEFNHISDMEDYSSDDDVNENINIEDDEDDINEEDNNFSFNSDLFSINFKNKTMSFDRMPLFHVYDNNIESWSLDEKSIIYKDHIVYINFLEFGNLSLFKLLNMFKCKIIKGIVFDTCNIACIDNDSRDEYNFRVEIFEGNNNSDTGYDLDQIDFLTFINTEVSNINAVMMSGLQFVFLQNSTLMYNYFPTDPVIIHSYEIIDYESIVDIEKIRKQAYMHFNNISCDSIESYIEGVIEDVEMFFEKYPDKKEITLKQLSIDSLSNLEVEKVVDLIAFITSFNDIDDDTNCICCTNVTYKTLDCCKIYICKNCISKFSKCPICKQKP